jgi:ADP-heptose:LPS heptosyltransferase
MVQRDTPWRIVIIGDKPEEAATRELAGALGSSALNLAGCTDVAELGWVLVHAAGVVTRDTGPSHLGGAVGARTVSICGRTKPIYHPKRWGALGPRVELVVKCPRKRLFEKHWDHWRRSFAAITPEEVFQALLRVSKLP